MSDEAAPENGSFNPVRWFMGLPVPSRIAIVVFTVAAVIFSVVGYYFGTIFPLLLALGFLVYAVVLAFCRRLARRDPRRSFLTHEATRTAILALALLPALIELFLFLRWAIGVGDGEFIYLLLVPWGIGMLVGSPFYHLFKEKGLAPRIGLAVGVVVSGVAMAVVLGSRNIIDAELVVPGVAGIGGFVFRLFSNPKSGSSDDDDDDRSSSSSSGSRRRSGSSRSSSGSKRGGGGGGRIGGGSRGGGGGGRFGSSSRGGGRGGRF
ncbi:MAG: hypothetical protein LBM23_02155 [Propionibacteriaceae bacterium]|nr:hypothetical protein [Propionibacteriaceae bacterium]